MRPPNPAEPPAHKDSSNPVEGLDLTRAWELARGERQRRWLAALLDPDNGLRPGDGASGRWASAVYQRIEAFVSNLRCAGYVIERRAFGPRRIMRFALVGSSRPYGWIAQIRAAGVHDALDDNGVPHPDLLALSPSQLEILLGLAGSHDRRASAARLADVVRRLSD